MSYIYIIRLYFSAHWCPPCRKFTPVLATAYNAHSLSSSEGNTDDNDAAAANTVDAIEVIFISLDSVKSEYDAYRNTMPWLSVSYIAHLESFACSILDHHPGC
jgi:nucleoredoxin